MSRRSRLSREELEVHNALSMSGSDHLSCRLLPLLKRLPKDEEIPAMLSCQDRKALQMAADMSKDNIIVSVRPRVFLRREYTLEQNLISVSNAYKTSIFTFRARPVRQRYPKDLYRNSCSSSHARSPENQGLREYIERRGINAPGSNSSGSSGRGTSQGSPHESYQRLITSHRGSPQNTQGVPQPSSSSVRISPNRLTLVKTST
ncbi:unnamed protein product, partial [Meganyctiphanes norvegica]